MAFSSAVSRNNREVRPRAGSANRDHQRRRGSLPLFGRIVLANAVVLLAACFAILVVLSPTSASQAP
jgi:hypothetical protein